MSNILYQKISSTDEMELLKSIENIIVETNAHDQTSKNIINWSWQFKNLPSKSSHVYVAKLNNTIIGYYHIPIFKFVFKKQIIRIGNVQSVAILKEYRKKGIFENLSQFANKDIENYVDLLYTFPNDNSIHTFLKYNNYTFLKTLPVYIFPLDFTKIFNSRLPKFISKLLSKILRQISYSKSLKVDENEVIKRSELLSNENMNLINNYNSQFKYYLLRDKKFLKWKYEDSPKSKYFNITLSTGGNILASILLKFDKMFNNNCIIIMDYAYDNLLSIKKLLSNLDKLDIVKSQNPSLIMLTGLNRDLQNISKCGFFKVPKFLIPRKLNLLIKSCSKEILPSKLNIEDWHISLSDWDVL